MPYIKIKAVRFENQITVDNQLKEIIAYEVERDIDIFGGKYFTKLEEAEKYFKEQISLCKEQKSLDKKNRCEDFEIFNFIQINKLYWQGEELVDGIVVKSYACQE